MKNLLKFALVAFAFTSSVAIAQEAAAPAPVELTKPETAIDNAISAPKSETVEKSAAPVAEKKASVQKKSAHKAKKHAKHHKKSHGKKHKSKKKHHKA